MGSTHALQTKQVNTNNETSLGEPLRNPMGRPSREDRAVGSTQEGTSGGLPLLDLMLLEAMDLLASNGLWLGSGLLMVSALASSGQQISPTLGLQHLLTAMGFFISGHLMVTAWVSSQDPQTKRKTLKTECLYLLLPMPFSKNTHSTSAFQKKNEAVALFVVPVLQMCRKI